MIRCNAHPVLVTLGVHSARILGAEGINYGHCEVVGFIRHLQSTLIFTLKVGRLESAASRAQASLGIPFRN
jgi:hypothetical protein